VHLPVLPRELIDARSPEGQELLLDVASYKYPPVWVSAEALCKAMNTLDSDSGKTRGFVVVREAGQ
jgi:hypothetical protein